MGLASSGSRRTSTAALAGRHLHVEKDRSISRKELASAGRDAMKALLLRPAERQILGELIGCWGEVMVGDRVLVYPSNEYLVRRTGLSERAVRYGIRRLVDRTLITPKDSANGKRFAIKNRAGELVDVFGFDLTPVYARRGEWVDLIAAQDAESEARARLFDEVTICRRAIEEALSALARLSEKPLQISDSLAELVERTPRRNLTVAKEVLVPIVESWRTLRTSAEETFYRAASGGKSCPHIETKPSESIKPNLKQEVSEETACGEFPTPDFRPFTVDLVVEACPSLLDYVAKPESEVDLVAAGRYLRSSLGAHVSVWDEAVEDLGPIGAATAVCITLELHERSIRDKTTPIRNPGGYLRTMVRMAKDHRLNLRNELLSLIRKRNE